ncbi:syndecan-4 [Heterodontus francisci]|uniref:syndecan-4 n=1 Tax=Heterodontus francisci TaxID=7792 RepID=UPI00355B84B5
MLKITALVTLFLISLWGTSSAKTQRELLSKRNYLNDLEGSGFEGLSKLYPDYEEEDGSGLASGDSDEMDEGKEPIDDEDDEMDNRISESDEDLTDVEAPVVKNEVHMPDKTVLQEDVGNRIAMASKNNSSVFESTEMLAAMIAGGTIGLLFAILLILLLVYRMRKKDEGSYDLSKKPIYKKAPTTEFYA